MDKQHITEIENTLSLFNSKTCDIEKFKEYIKMKNSENINGIRISIQKE